MLSIWKAIFQKNFIISLKYFSSGNYNLLNLFCKPSFLIGIFAFILVSFLGNINYFPQGVKGRLVLLTPLA
jgi:hypothetical protein